MIATVDIADLGTTGTVRAIRGRPRAGRVPGLQWADVAVAAVLGANRPPTLRRAALLAFWDDEDAAVRFETGHPAAAPFEGGLHLRLRPLRSFGSWPGLPEDLPHTRAVPHDGAVVVLTLGRLRLSQTIRFIRASRPAERAAVASDGLIWGTAAARPPFVATVSVWASSRDAAAFAYGQQRPAHADAISQQERKDFHRQSAFVRFSPVHIAGSLTGDNGADLSAVIA